MMNFSVPVFQDSTWAAKWVQGRRGRPASSRSPLSASPTGSSKCPFRSTGKWSPGAKRTRKWRKQLYCSPTNNAKIWQVQDHGSYLQLRHQGYFLVPTRSRTLPLPHPQCRTSSPQGTHLRYVPVECEPPSVRPPPARRPVDAAGCMRASNSVSQQLFRSRVCVQLYWRWNTLPP